MSGTGNSGQLSRRTFAALLAASGPAGAAAAGQQNPGPPAPGNFQRPLAPDTPAFEGPLEFARKIVTPKAEPFPMAAVRLLPDSVYHDAQEWNRGYMARLEADRLLYTFRANAGLPPGPAKPLGGWEQPENGQRSSELRGHFAGHFLSASAQLAAGGDEAARAKGDYMVAEMAKCQQRLGGKYLSAFPTTWWDRLEKGERVWAPFYTIHKIMAGMFDMYSLAGNQQALQVLEGMAAWADEWTAPKTDQHMQQILTIEFGGIAETLYRLAAATNNDRWAAMGDRFQKRSFLNPLAARRDELRGLHANTHIPQVIASARRYDLSGDMRFHDVACYFFDEVATARTYATGGTSNAEAWLAPPRRLAAELKLSVNTAECCCAYNMLKLARHLYGWDPNPSYFDYYEHLLLNHRIGTIRPKTGNTQYYLSLAPGVWKTFGTEDQTFWCCTGSGIEEYSKLNDSIYWRDSEGLYVNLFVPSELDWAERGFKLRQETKYPASQSTALTVTAARPGADGNPAANSGMAPDCSASSGQRQGNRRLGGTRQLPRIETRLESGRPDRTGASDAPACAGHARRSGHAGIPLRTAGARRGSRWRGADGGAHHRAQPAGRGAERSAIRFAARAAEYGATRSGDRDPDIPGLGRGSGCLDSAGWTAAGISHHRPKEERDAGST